MIHWINSHGVEVLIVGWLWAAAVGTMPKLPEGSSFWAQWGYGFLHVTAANLKQAANLLNIKLPNGDGK